MHPTLLSKYLSSWRNCFIYTSSQVIDVIALYSTSSKYIMFIAFLRNNILSNEKQYIVVECLSIGDHGQSVS